MSELNLSSAKTLLCLFAGRLSHFFADAPFQLPQMPATPDATAFLYSIPSQLSGTPAANSLSSVPKGSYSNVAGQKLAVKLPVSKQQLKAKGGTSKYKGVTKHSTTGRYEAHLWDSTFVRVKSHKGGRARGKQIYLGGFKNEQQAARAYDVASLKYWGSGTETNVSSASLHSIPAQDPECFSLLDMHL